MPWGGTATHRVGYFGFNRPRFRTVMLTDGEWTIDVIDTWNMTMERVPGTHRGTARVELPGRPFMALRTVRVGD